MTDKEWIPIKGRGCTTPLAGYISKCDGKNGLVEITDSFNGMVVARIRHLWPIAVKTGQFVAYGQTLGTQSAAGLPHGTGKHVHVEVDTNYLKHFESYMDDLASGRLPVRARHRDGVQSADVADDGTFRLGQSSERVRDLQRVMSAEGYRAADGGPLDQDGVYRLSMQGALLDFQRAHGLPQTGDADPATLLMAPARHPSEPTAPGHPGHPDHRHKLSDPLPLPVNQPRPGAHPGLSDADARLLERMRAGVRNLDAQGGKDWDEYSERLSAGLLILAKENGFSATSDMQIAFNRQTARHAAGAFVHLSRTGANRSADPAADHVCMSTADALAMPAEERYRQASVGNRMQMCEADPAQNQPNSHAHDRQVASRLMA